MRLIALSIALLMSSACVAPVVSPRSYLDEETAATVTTVAQPWIFTGEQVAFAAKDGDYLDLFALDVNRMGAHRQYLAILVSTPPQAVSSNPLTLELTGGGQSVSLQPTTDTARLLGISKPLAPSYSTTARWWYFPVGKEIFATVVRSPDLTATLVVGGERVRFTTWRDGSADVDKFNAALP